MSTTSLLDKTNYNTFGIVDDNFAESVALKLLAVTFGIFSYAVCFIIEFLNAQIVYFHITMENCGEIFVSFAA